MVNKKKKKILYIFNDFNFFLSHRKELIKKLLDLDNEVFLTTPYDSKIERYEDLPINIRVYSLDRTNLNIFSFLKSILEINKIIKKVNPDIIHSYTLKPILISLILNKLRKFDIKLINSFTGMGSLFSEKKFFFFKYLVLIIIKLCRGNSISIFQNTFDYLYFINAKIFKKKNVHLIKSSGVNINNFRGIEYNKYSNKVLFASRIFDQKGIKYFTDSAIEIKKKYPKLAIEMIVAGKYDEKKGNKITYKYLKQLHNKKIINFIGFEKNITKLLSDISIICLPTEYAEGIPKILLEAGISGIPAIVSQNIGCREIVKNLKNGIVLKDNNDLCIEIIKLQQDFELKEKLSYNAKKIVEKKFNINNVINRTIDLYF